MDHRFNVLTEKHEDLKLRMEAISKNRENGVLLAFNCEKTCYLIWIRGQSPSINDLDSSKKVITETKVLKVKLKKYASVKADWIMHSAKLKLTDT